MCEEMEKREKEEERMVLRSEEKGERDGISLWWGDLASKSTEWRSLGCIQSKDIFFFACESK